VEPRKEEEEEEKYDINNKSLVGLEVTLTGDYAL
jgi:hypothetical protein